MNKLILLLFFLPFLLNPIFSQSDSISINEIDQQIWYPFMAAYNNWDAEAFNELHDKDMLRGSPWGLKSGADYFAQNIKQFEKGKLAGELRNISFTFEYRVHEENIAYEVGYYKVVSKRENGNAVYFGQFHVVLKKMDGKWKIFQDWDADRLNGEKIGEEQFLKFSGNGIYEMK
ncbi:MAG: nuclear transport factor 2 family protein [Saprospiraceae bacterium]